MLRSFFLVIGCLFCRGYFAHRANDAAYDAARTKGGDRKILLGEMALFTALELASALILVGVLVSSAQ